MQFHPYIPIVVKSGVLSFLETSGPLQARTEIFLPFTSLNCVGICYEVCEEDVSNITR
jgi:hypothetical protein